MSQFNTEPRAFEHSSSILRFVTIDDPAQADANKSIASMLQRLCLLLKHDTLFGSPELSDSTDQQIADIFGDQEKTPLECYSCKNYSHSPYLKCAINPSRKTDQECYQFETIISDWNRNEDNPANYSDWDSNENNPANYSEY
jgi:hypothetical protein